MFDRVIAIGLLIVAAGTFVLSIAFGFPVTSIYESPVALTGLMIMMGGGVAFAAGLRTIADEALGGAPSPWYASAAGLLLLLFTLAALNGFLWYGYECMNITWLDEAFPPLARVFAGASLQLFCVVVFDWPTEQVARSSPYRPRRDFVAYMPSPSLPQKRRASDGHRSRGRSSSRLCEPRRLR